MYMCVYIYIYICNIVRPRTTSARSARTPQRPNNIIFYNMVWHSMVWYSMIYYSMM